MIYAVTVKKTRGPIVMGHYVDYLAWLAQRGLILNLNFEDTRGLHCHFMFDSKTYMTAQDWKYEKYGWSIRATKLWDETVWNRYCMKDAHKPLNKAYLLECGRKLVCDLVDENDVDDIYDDIVIPPQQKLFS